MNGAGGKVLPVFQRPVVGRKLNLDAATRQRRGERGGREKMAASAACGEKNAARSAHSAATR